MTKTQWSDLPQEVQDATSQELGGVSGVEMISEGLNSDIHADAQYRAHLVTVMAKKAVAAAILSS